ncbi:hypothetical protein [Aquimarina spongiae]|uniref:MG2 domain-containing protein n=1 Tax=Aquimarina spongiae TaxID=570521 RepID=A0A1M6CE53_9FLAO|nr:hypothetical protein [Aquimarina spongiae]SHI59121.1 hypothetical protein SAMN04488508_10267 [Aquimarina spongiae]
MQKKVKYRTVLKTYVVLSVFLFSSLVGYSQRLTELRTNQEVLQYSQIPQERIFVHYNSTLLFCGEYLYYSLYCINNQNRQLSDISKIAYVKLVNQNKETVLQQKVMLHSGLAQGDFFIPVDLPSGNYKLLAYTQWMLNAEEVPFFQGDVSILNPYQGNQDNVLANDLKQSSELNNQEEHIVIPKENIKDVMTVFLDKEKYATRRKVKLAIENTLDTPISYSLSVRKVNTIHAVTPIKTIDFDELDPNQLRSKQKSAGESLFLPEMRGELIYGKIVSRDSLYKLSNVPVALSTVDGENHISIVATDPNGNFVFNIPHNQQGAGISFVQVLDTQKEKYSIILDEIPSPNPQSFNMHKLTITPAMRKEILQRSIYNQVDNSFYNIKPDTISEVKKEKPFYGQLYENYNLNDYTRFATVKETLVEIVDKVWTRRSGTKGEVFAIQGNYAIKKDDNFLPLVLVDGILVQEQEEVLNYDARKVKSIGFLPDRYYLGAEVYDGLISIKTLDGNYFDEFNKSYIKQITTHRPAREKQYYKQNYTTTKYDRIPDYRYQLCWEPKIQIDPDRKNELHFFTSDVVGTYEIALEGFTLNGTPISVRKLFTVE